MRPFPCSRTNKRRVAPRSTLRVPSAQAHERRVAPKPISTFISLETGQPAFAFAAINWNAASSMPGIFAVTEMDRGDGKAIAVLVDGDIRFAVDLLRTKFE